MAGVWGVLGATASQETIVLSSLLVMYAKNKATVNDKLSNKSGRETLIFRVCFPKTRNLK